MKNKKSILGRIKAAAVGAAVAATALIAPVSVKDTDVTAAGNINYAKALQYSLYLYDANMCGKGVDSNCQLKWRGNCHTYDSAVSTPYGTLDLSGGFHDAGDHAKFGLPGAYSATVLGWSYYEFKDAFTQTGQAGHLKTITDYFCDYFRRCTVMDGGNVKAFCYQVGDGNVDHSSWQSPEKDTMQRPVTFADAGNPATDVVAETAAALAMNYVNLGNKDDLTYAEALYKFAKTNNKSGHAEQSFYTGTSWLDDLALAAVILNKATNNSEYLTDCGNWIQQSNWAYTSNYPLCWDSVWPAVNALYGKEWDRVAANVDATKAQTTSEGYSAINDWGSARYNTASQMVGLVYDKHNSSKYAEWSKGQMEYLFGNNKNNQCYMVGYDSNSVKYPHHRAASGYTNFPSENRGVPYANVLVGALVGGPDKSGNYKDEPDEYTYTEVACDYNAGFVGALAGLYLKYGAGQSVESSVPGAKSGSSQPVITQPIETQPVVTTTTTTYYNYDPIITTTSTSYSPSIPQSGNGVYEVKVNKAIDYSQLPADDKMIGFSWKDFGIKSGEYATKIEFNLSSSKNLGTWVGAFGSSTTVAPDYWTMSDEMNKPLSGNNATVTWEPSADAAKTFAYSAGDLKFGVWWIDCGQFNIDSIKVYTSGGSTTPVVITTTSTTAATTTTTTTTTVTTTTTTKSPSQNETQPVTTTTQPKNDDFDRSKVKYGDVDLDGAVGLSDVTALSKYLLNKSTFRLSALQQENADCKHDGVVDSVDLSVLIEYNLGKNVHLGV